MSDTRQDYRQMERDSRTDGTAIELDAAEAEVWGEAR